MASGKDSKKTERRLKLTSRLSPEYLDILKKMRAKSAGMRVENKKRMTEDDARAKEYTQLRINTAKTPQELQKVISDESLWKKELGYQHGLREGNKLRKQGKRVAGEKPVKPKFTVENVDDIQKNILKQIEFAEQEGYYEGVKEAVEGIRETNELKIRKPVLSRFQFKKVAKFVPWQKFRKMIQREAPIVKELEEFRKFEVDKGAAGGENIEQLRDRVLNYLNYNPELMQSVYKNAQIVRYKGKEDKDINVVVLGKKGIGHSYINYKELNNFIPLGSIQLAKKASPLPFFVRIETAKEIIEAGETIEESAGAWHGAGVGRKDRVTPNEFYRAYEGTANASRVKKGEEITEYDEEFARKQGAEETRGATARVSSAKAEEGEKGKKAAAKKQSGSVKMINAENMQQIFKLVLIVIVLVLILGFASWLARIFQ